jgi:vacuolar iron transporter family protein
MSPPPDAAATGVLASVAVVLDQPTLRSLVVETNDGIIATAGVVGGFAGAGATGVALVVAAVCATVAGAVALAGARYAEEAAERDARIALVEKERDQLQRSPQTELAELVALYEGKGLSPELARQVATELTAQDPLAAHLDAEHHLTVRDLRWAPVLIAAAAGVAYALGALIPLLSVLLAPDAWRAAVTFVATLVSLTVTPLILARMGVSDVRRTLTRTVLVGVTAMLLSFAAGNLVAHLQS